MGTITHIEKARRFGFASLPYQGFLMPTTHPDLLFMIKLPMGDLGRSVDVLAHLTSAEPSEITVVLDDSHMPAISRRFIGQKTIPAQYAPRSMGTITEYLGKHEEALHHVIAAGGAAYGNLTLARAVHLMDTEHATAQDALAMSLRISAEVRDFQQSQERSVVNMLSI